MPKLKKNILSIKQINSIAKEADCTKLQAMSRIESAIKCGMDIDYFFNQSFFMLGSKQLESYMANSNLRRYVNALSGSDDLSDYEIYRQMRRAKKEFDIPYSVFANQKLVNASDKQLERVKRRMVARKENAISKIADALGVTIEEAEEKVASIKSKFGYGAQAIYEKQLFLMDDDQIAALMAETSSRKNEFVKKVMDETGWPEEKVRSQMDKFLVDYGIDASLYYYRRCFEMDQYELTLRANFKESKQLSMMYNRNLRFVDNKELFSQTYKDFIGRKFWINRDTDFEDFCKFAEGLDEIFCKPVDSMEGRGAYKFSLTGKDLREVYDEFMGDRKYIFEECISQHPEMAKFNPESINTVRIITILKNGKFDPFLAIARFGRGGIVDNFAAGGIACAIDTKTGILASNGCNNEGETFEVHPITGEKFKGFQIPHWDKALEVAEAALRLREDINYVGWDLAITPDGVVIVEGNTAPGFGAQQTTWLSEGELVRHRYYKYLGTSVYDDMLDKVVENMRLTGLPEKEVTRRLNAASKAGFDYDAVMDKGLCNLTVEEISSLGESCDNAS